MRGVQALIAKAKELVPGKPVTQAIVSHHHFDHTAGLRAAVAEGLTIITHRVNEAWFREAVARKHTIVVDALARSPKPLKIVVFDDSYSIKDASMEDDAVPPGEQYARRRDPGGVFSARAGLRRA